MEKHKDYVIADIKLADWGRRITVLAVLRVPERHKLVAHVFGQRKAHRAERKLAQPLPFLRGQCDLVHLALHVPW